MDELAKRIAELSDRYGPAAVDAARGAATMEAWSALYSNVMCALVAATLIVLGHRLWNAKGWTDGDDFNFAKIAAVIACCIGGIFGLIFVFGISDPWMWSTFKNPDLWIAKKVLKL